MSLTESKVRQAKPREKIYFLADDDGLSLKIEPNGTKSWSYRFSVRGSNKRSRIKLGVYPDMSLKEARSERDERKLIATYPHRSNKKDHVLLFSQVAEEWLAFKRKNALDDVPRCGVVQLAQKCLESDILPELGELSFQEIRRFELVSVIRKIEYRGVKEPTKKACSYLNQLYDYAVAMGYCEFNIASGLHKVLITQKIKRHYPYLKTGEDLAGFTLRLNEVNSHPIIKKALWLKLYTGARGAEILAAEPQHFDLKNKIWRIPAHHVKQFRRKVILGFEIPDYIIPLSTQAVEIVKSALEWSFGEKYVFSSPMRKDKPLHFNTLNSVIRRMGYEKNQLSSHGLRSTLSTILNESGLFQHSWIEAQLSHTDKDKTRASYNHAQYLEHRHEMMQWWADYLTTVK
ncbi:tyrosine-type recombinase/integrase [Acinetobacter sp. CAAS 2-6]|uniref:tyrosine-type recombinase/integrase n=1 Tax=Acinetobacter sp. CAAS 2-6 TaxID=3016358 RepID=UPI002DD64536|nr:integrase arm-type DNA-binding domain-containing protein [Acinetobacter sp. CAAS 2-6]